MPALFFIPSSVNSCCTLAVLPPFPSVWLPKHLFLSFFDGFDFSFAFLELVESAETQSTTTERKRREKSLVVKKYFQQNEA